MNWFRWYHSTTTDPKLALVAHLSGQPMHLVIAVWAGLLETASQAHPRGCVEAFDPECQQVTLQTTEHNISKIVAVMKQKEMIIDSKIGKWGARQCDPGAAERMRKYRERLKTQDGTVTDVTVTLRPVTDVTPEEKRRDKKKTIEHFPNAQQIFDQCWAEYPNKIGKDEALRHFNAQVKTVDDAKTLFASIQNYTEIAKDREKKHIKHGSAFFNKLWRDYAE